MLCTTVNSTSEDREACSRDGSGGMVRNVDSCVAVCASKTTTAEDIGQVYVLVKYTYED